MNSQESLDLLIATAGCAAIALHWLALGLDLGTATVFKGMAVAAVAMAATCAIGGLRRR